MTEEEARNKWCPFARYSSGSSGHGGAGGSWNRSNRDDAPTTFCIASDCMAWRWNKATDNVRQYANEKGLLVVETGEEGMGYCGLAQ